MRFYEMKCDTCSYQVHGVAGAQYVIMDDGSERALTTPGEPGFAEELTGKSWWELFRTHRFVNRSTLVCLACGEAERYARTDPSFKPWLDNGSGIEPYSCKSCGALQLYPIGGRQGLSALLRALLRLPEESVACPVCREGRLHSKMLGMT